MFDNIKNYDNWDEPSYVFRQNLNDEVCRDELTIESAIREDRPFQ